MGHESMITDEDASKDRFFARVGDLAHEMIVAHGKDFAIGVLILAARFIAEKRPVKRPTAGEDSL
jgi:hypothetical protein